MIFKPSDKIVFIGDSITDAGRREDPLGNGVGYFNLVRSLLLARYPELQLTFRNQGISGNTVRHLDSRWETDVIAEKPHWLSVMIGINDVWRTYDSGGTGAVSIEDYESIYRSLLQKAVDETSCKLIVASPFMIEPDRSVPMRAQMDAYGAVAKSLAEEFNAIFVDTQAAFDKALESTTPDAWAHDQIHPGTPGHAVIALAFLQAFGFEA